MSKKVDIVINVTDKFVIIKSAMGLDKLNPEDATSDNISKVIYKHIQLLTD